MLNQRRRLVFIPKAIIVALVLAALTLPSAGRVAAQPAAKSPAAAHGGMRIVVTPFRATAAQGNPLAAALDPRLSTNLSKSHQIVVLERSRLEEAMKALKIESSAVIDPQLAVKIGSFLSATHIVVGEVGQVAGTLSLNARTVAVDTGVVVADASKTVDGTDKEAFTLVDLLSTYILKGLTSETITFPGKIVEYPFSIKPTRHRPLPSPTRISEPFFTRKTPPIEIRYRADYYPPTSPMEMARGTDKVRRIQLLVNDEVVASWGADATASKLETGVKLEVGDATAITQSQIAKASSKIRGVSVDTILEVKGTLTIEMRP